MSMTVATLLLTDVVDSTKLVESLGDVRASQVWAAHDALARELLPAHGGREIDKTDGFLLLFDGPQEAVAYALAYHAALGALDPPLQARAGLHRGEVVLRENPAAHVARGAKPLEVEGLAKPLAARVMSLAVGGQTLLTGPVRTALGDDAAVRSHGHYRMKGVAEPVELFELDTGAALTPPPDSAKVWRVQRQGDGWVAAEPPPHSLPAERDAFVGRDADLSALSRLLDDGARLVSVLGIGGTGKTRLVTRFAWTWLGAWPGGAWFVDLSEARSLEGVVAAVGAALDVPLSAGDPVERLGHALSARGPCLLLLDNFEQVARHAEETVGRWLELAPRAQLVVTTREVLGVPGEQALVLPPLSTDDAVALFVRRAQAAGARIALAGADGPAVAALVELLDRLPLAIELAAARARMLSPQGLLDRMSDRFRLLSSGGRRRDRQATLRAAIDWSWELLTPAEQHALAQVSVFEGGFTLDDAEAVVDVREVDDGAWTMDLVGALVDKSLVRVVGGERYDLLVSVQEYAAEKLEALGGRAAAEARHGACFATRGAPEALAALALHGGPQRRRALQVDIDNLVAASRRAVGRGDADLAARAGIAAGQVLLGTGPMQAARALCQEIGALPGLSALDRGELLLVEAHAAKFLGDGDAAGALVERVRELARTAGAPRLEFLALEQQANIALRQARHDAAVAALEQAEACAATQADPWVEAHALALRATVQTMLGQLEGLAERYEQAVARARQVGDVRLEAGMRTNYGRALVHAGRFEAALPLLQSAVPLHEEAGDQAWEAAGRSVLGLALQQLGHLDEALVEQQRSMEMLRALGDAWGEAQALNNLGNLHLARGSLAAAEEAFGAARRLVAAGDRLFQAALDANLAEVAMRLGRVADARAAWLALVERPEVQAFPPMLAHLHLNLVELELEAGDLQAARRHLDAALVLLPKDVSTVMVPGKELVLAARLALALGDPSEARVHLAQAEALAEAEGLGEQAELRVWIGQVRAALG